MIDQIEVKTIDKQNHQLKIKFTSPFVDDKLEWNVKGKPKKGYKVIEGVKEYQFNLEQIDGNEVSKKNTLTT